MLLRRSFVIRHTWVFGKCDNDDMVDQISQNGFGFGRVEGCVCVCHSQEVEVEDKVQRYRTKVKERGEHPPWLLEGRKEGPRGGDRLERRRTKEMIVRHSKACCGRNQLVKLT